MSKRPAARTSRSARATDRVRAVVEAIPAGEVMSYGEVAVLAGLHSARQVGWILSRIEGVPWHRVLRADGTPAPHLAGRQIAALEAEGVCFVNGHVARPMKDGATSD